MSIEKLPNPEIEKPYLSQLGKEAARLHDSGFKILPLNGKKPTIKEWQIKKFSPDQVMKTLTHCKSPGLGVQLGPKSGIIDIEYDSAEQHEAARVLLGDDIDKCPAFRSRKGGHYLAKWDDRLEAIGKATIDIPVSHGDPLKVRIGAGGKGAQSAFPPSKDKEWLEGRSIREIAPPALSEETVAKLISYGSGVFELEDEDEGGVSEEALRAMHRATVRMGDCQDGSRRLFTVACRAVEFDLSDSSALATIFAYEEEEPFPRYYTDEEILQRVRDAEEKVVRGCKRSFELTDLGNAERFAWQHRDKLRYVWTWKKWLVWNGRYWAEDNTGAAHRLAGETARSIHSVAAEALDEKSQESLGRWALKSASKQSINAMIELARSRPPLVISHEELNKDNWLLNCKNGTLDLRTGELRPHDPADLITKCTKVDCDLSSPSAGLWDTFLSQIFTEDQELIDYVQALMGVSLIGDQIEHIFPILYGHGANGKSVFTGTILNALGDYATQAPRDLFVVGRGSDHPTKYTVLYGARVVFASETDDGQKLNEGLVKSITGGDRIKARGMHEDFWDFEPTHTAFMATNYKPEVRGTDNGIWRRLKLIPFLKTFKPEEQDRELPEKLKEHLSQVLGWMARGCQRYLAQPKGSKLNEPASVKGATDDYRSESDRFTAWHDECCQQEEGARWKVSEALEHYEGWCLKEGEQPLKPKDFRAKMEGRYGKDRSNRGNHYPNVKPGVNLDGSLVEGIKEMFD